jgi:hypothetical protein
MAHTFVASGLQLCTLVGLLAACAGGDAKPHLFYILVSRTACLFDRDEINLQIEFANHARTRSIVAAPSNLALDSSQCMS